ncbi:YcxB family protein [Luteimonas sp. A501]
MITAAISSKDYLTALRLHRKRAVTRQLLVLAVLAATGVLVIAVGYMLIGLILIGAGVGGLIGELVQSKLILPGRAEKIYNQQASLRATYTYSWDNDGLSVSSETGHARRPWSDYIKFLESDQLFLLYHSDIMFEIFPKSWFSRQEQAGEFRALASRVGT